MKERKVTLYRKRRKLGVADLNKRPLKENGAFRAGDAFSLAELQSPPLATPVVGPGENLSSSWCSIRDIPAQKCKAVTGGVCMRAPTSGMPDSILLFKI